VVSTAANASHLLLELLQRGDFAVSIVLWRDSESEREYEEGTERMIEIRIARARERIRDLTKKREYKRIEDGRRRNGDREGSEVSEGKATNSVTVSLARPN